MIDLQIIVSISIDAGKRILEVYDSADFQVEDKEDKSPLTLADRKSHDVIVEGLSNRYPAIPILSEEGRYLGFKERKNWDEFWLVDPLDGTKEFIKRNGEFTVNIALIKNGKPVTGVIYAPVLDTLYFSSEEIGSFKLENASEEPIDTQEQLLELGRKLPIVTEKDKVFAVASRSHLSKETEEFLNKIKEQVGDIEITSAGSSLKLCMVAEGRADVYPRFAPTMEWDTGAGQAIVEHAGGSVMNVETNKPLAYNKENLLNPWFIVGRKGFEL